MPNKDLVEVKRFFFAPTESNTEEECQRLLLRSGFYRIYATASWEKFSLTEEVKEFLRHDYFEAQEHLPRGMFITGSIGIGKTSLCALIGKSLVNHWRLIPRFVSTGTLFDMYFERKHTEIEDLMRSNVLFLDDLGREYSADFPTAKFENFIEFRYGNLLPTFITSNLLMEDLRKRPAFERIADRINDPRWMKHLTLVGESLRRRV
jgi:DNA replication protein DnaC